MRKADETPHFFFGSLNILRIRNIFVVLIPITIRTVEKLDNFMLKLSRKFQPFTIFCVYISESSFQGGQNEQNRC